MLKEKKKKSNICLLLGIRTYKYRLQRPTMKRRVAYLLQLEGEPPGLGERQKVQIF